MEKNKFSEVMHTVFTVIEFTAVFAMAAVFVVSGLII